jgi:hypothetical protein
MSFGIRFRWIYSGLFVFLFFLFSTVVWADMAKAEDNRVSIQFSFLGDKEANKIVPVVNVYTIDLSTGERRKENYMYENQAFSPPQGFQVNGWGDAEKTTKDAKGELFRKNYSSYTVNTHEGIKGYSLYSGRTYTEKVVDEWSTFEDNVIDRQRLYVFNDTTKELKLINEGTIRKKMPATITYSYFTDIRTKEKLKEMDVWDYTYSGTAMSEPYIHADLYLFTDYAAKTRTLYSLSNNTYVATVPFDSKGMIDTKSLNLCIQGNHCFQTDGNASFNDNLVFKKNGKYYEILQNKSIKEIKEDKYDWSQYQWRIVVNNQVFGKRWIDGWHYIINTNNNKVKKISERHTFVRQVTVSPDHKYMAIFEAAYNKDNPKHSYEDEQVRIYDINKQKEVRVIKLPYRGEGPMDVIWHSNTVLQYVPYSSNSPVYIRNVNVEILTGIMTKDLYGGHEREGEYIIEAADKSKYFSFARPLEIRYQGKAIQYSKQPSFEGENGLVYCSLKDLANGLGADIKVESGSVKLTLKGKSATVNLKDKEVITFDGTAYAPIKSIVLKLGLQYSREDLFSSQINLE